MEKMRKTKKLNNKGMTLVEVIASMGILAIVSLVIYNGADSILRGLEVGQFVYKSNGVIEKRLEEKTVVGEDDDKVTFEVNGTPVEVKGHYHTEETKNEEKIIIETKVDNEIVLKTLTISYTLFIPKGSD